MVVRSPRYNSSALYEFANDLMGQIYPPDVQCEAINGKGSYMCRVHLIIHMLFKCILDENIYFHEL